MNPLTSPKISPRRLTLEDVFTNSDMTQLFRVYCEKERSVENYLFLERVSVYKFTKSEQKRLVIARDIVENFLLESSKYQVNLDRESVESVHVKLKSPFSGLDPSCPESLFDGLEKQIEVVMMDTLMRFDKVLRSEEMKSEQFVNIEQKQSRFSSLIKHGTETFLEITTPRANRDRKDSQAPQDFSIAIEEYMKIKRSTPTGSPQPNSVLKNLGFNSVSESEPEMSPMQRRKMMMMKKRELEEIKKDGESDLSELKSGNPLDSPKLPKKK